MDKYARFSREQFLALTVYTLEEFCARYRPFALAL
jgi:hypothetical protein